jgi:hypothetical protein
MGRYGKSINNYIEEISGYKLIPEQIQCLNFLKDLDKKQQIISAGRGFSKTMLSSGTVMWFADEYASYKHVDLEILLISSQQRMYYHLNKFFSDNKERFGYNEETKKFSRLKQGGIYDALLKEKTELYSQDGDNVTAIYPCMSTSKSVRSHRADIVIIDEAAEIKKEVIIAAVGCLEGDISKLLMISTPHIAESYFVEVVTDPKKYGFESFTASSEICEWRKESNKIAKGMLTVAEYAAEILGRPPTLDERSFFPSKHIDKCILECTEGREGGEDSYTEVGIDFGFNRTIYVLSEKIGTVKRKVLFVKEWKECSIEDIAPEIGKLIVTHAPKFIKADSKPKHNRGQIEKFCRKRIDYIDAGLEVHVTDDGDKEVWSTHKEQMLGQLQRKVREHNLIIPIYPFTEGLITELRKYRRKMTTGDDIVDATALSCYQPVIPLGSTTAGCVYFSKPESKKFTFPVNRRF